MSALLPPGSILAASPEMLDPNFMHSVVQLCDHDEHGAFGLLLNRGTGATLRELAADHPDLGDLGLPVQEGGPVGRDRMQFLHRVPAHVAGGMPIVDDLHLGGDVAGLARHLRTVEEAGLEALDVRMFLGSSGWGPGQLEAELEASAWLVAPPAPDWAFRSEGREALWRAVLREIGPGAEGLGHLPPDVSWN